MILVCEDHDDLRRLIVAVLERAGLRAESVADGETALIAMHLEPPQLLVLDLMLPSKSGWDVRKEMLKSARLRRIPVIVATGVHARDLRVDELKVAQVMNKPLCGEDLVAAVRRHMLPEAS